MVSFQVVKKKLAWTHTRRFRVLVTLLLVFGILGQTFTRILADEISDRSLITIPSGTNTTIAGDVTLPASTYQDASISGNNLIIASNEAADSGFAKSINKIDLAINDYQFVFNIYTPANETDPASTDYGSAFVLFNDDTYAPQINSDYGALGIYGGNGAVQSIRNAVAVEFDNLNRVTTDGLYEYLPFDSANGTLTSQSHVAITTPINATSGSPIIHESLSNLPVPYANGTYTGVTTPQINTVKIEWKLTSAGATSSLDDNTYSLTYFYYQGGSTASGAPTVTGSKSFTYSQMLTQFGGTSTVNYGWGGSTAALIMNQQTINYVATYPYTVNYYIQLANGTNTTIPVPGSTPKTGSAPEGSYDVKPLPTFTNYTLAPGQTSAVTIAATSNVYNYYYIDAAPWFTGVDNTSVNQNSVFDPLAGVSASDIVDGTITLTAANVLENNVNTSVPGNYTVKYSVTDSVGNVTEAIRTITVLDTVPPNPPVISPIMEMLSAITGTGEAGTTVYVKLPDNTTLTSLVESNGTWTVPVTIPLIYGQTVTAWLVDSANNMSTETTSTVLQAFITLTINKVWSDSTNPATYPTLTFNVYQDGGTTPFAQLTLTSPNLQIVDTTTFPMYNGTGGLRNYTVTEVANADYSVTSTIDENSAGKLTYTFTNQRKATLSVTKVNQSNAPLDGITFELRNATGDLIGSGMTSGGKIEFPYLEVGVTYTLTETKTIGSYQLNEAPWTFTVDAATLLIEKTIVNYARLEMLPATGTAGRLLFWAAGVALLLIYVFRESIMKAFGLGGS